MKKKKKKYIEFDSEKEENLVSQNLLNKKVKRINEKHIVFQDDENEEIDNRQSKILKENKIKEVKTISLNNENDYFKKPKPVEQNQPKFYEKPKENKENDDEKIVVKKKFPKYKPVSRETFVDIITNTNAHSSEKSLTEYSNLAESYELIHPYNLENLDYLHKYFPGIFIKGTSILFRIYELSNDSKGPAPSKYKHGKIEEFIEDNKCFLIKLDDSYSKERVINSLSTTSDLYDIDVISVTLKDFIELRVEKSAMSEEYLKLDNDNIVTENIQQNTAPEENINDIFIASPMKNNKTPVKNPQKNMFHKIVYPHIKKQIEYYFSDKNYYDDAFLSEKAAQDSENCIIHYFI